MSHEQAWEIIKSALPALVTICEPVQILVSSERFPATDADGADYFIPLPVFGAPGFGSCFVDAVASTASLDGSFHLIHFVVFIHVKHLHCFLDWKQWSVPGRCQMGYL